MINASKHDGLNVYLYKKRQKTRRYFMTILDLCPCLVRYFRPGPHVGDCVCVCVCVPCWLMLLGLGWIQGHETCQTLQIQIEKKTRAVSLLHHMLPSERCVTLQAPEVTSDQITTSPSPIHTGLQWETNGDTGLDKRRCERPGEGPTHSTS